jgi:hypothetical protein
MTYDFLFHWSLHIFSAIGIFLVPVLIIMLRRRRTALARMAELDAERIISELFQKRPK